MLKKSQITISHRLLHIYVYFFRLTPKKALTFLAPCTMQCSGLIQIAEVMIHTAFNPELKSCTRLLGLQGLLKLYKNKDFLMKKSEELEKEIAGEIVKVCVDAFHSKGIYLGMTPPLLL